MYQSSEAEKLVDVVFVADLKKIASWVAGKWKCRKTLLFLHYRLNDCCRYLEAPKVKWNTVRISLSSGQIGAKKYQFLLKNKLVQKYIKMVLIFVQIVVQ